MKSTMWPLLTPSVSLHHPPIMSHPAHTFASFLLPVLPCWVRLLSKQKTKSWLFLSLSSRYECMRGFGKNQAVKPLHCILLHLPSLTSHLSLSFAVLILSMFGLCPVLQNKSGVVLYVYMCVCMCVFINYICESAIISRTSESELVN